MRLDVALVERGLARSRNNAAALIEADRVLVNGKIARKPAQAINDDAKLRLLDAVDYVSRAGHKLAKALDEFAELEIQGKVAMDVGASTGGFTDVLLRRGVAKVIAIDVGHEQMVAELLENPRVINLEGVNARDLTVESLASLLAEKTDATPIDKNIEIVVGDVSFISLTLVLAPLLALAPSADFVLLIKPQFEVGKQSLSASGIVSDHRLRAGAIKQVTDAAAKLGMGIRGLVRSELPGTHGNIEYVLWISSAEQVNQSKWTERIEALAKEGR